MKSKKILAVITLVAFMISILPMAAFASSASGYTSIVKIENGSAPAASTTDFVEIEVTAKDENYGIATGNIYVSTSRPTVDEIYGTSGWAKPGTNGVAVALDSEGKAVVKIRSSVVGTANVVIGTVPGKVVEYAVKKEGVSALDAGALRYSGENYYIPVEFTSPKANTLSLSIKDADYAYANGVAYVTVKAELKSGSVPVVGKDVEFEVLPSGATLSATKVTTDASGVAEVKVFATKSGEYTVTAKAADVSDATQLVHFVSTGVVDVKAESDDNQKVARESSGTFKLQFSFYDANGNKVNIPAGINSTSTYYASDAFTASSGIQGAELRMVTRPSNVAIKEKPVLGTDFDLEEDDGNLVVALNKSRLNKDGDYEIRLTLVNGKTVSYKFNVKEQGDVTEMKISYKSSSYASGAAVPAAKIELLDAEGYKTEISSGVTFSHNNPKLIKTGTTFNTSTGAFTASDEESGVLTVTAVHNSKNLVATTTVNIEKPAAYLKLTAPTYTAVGNEASVAVQLVDIDGKPVSVGGSGTVTYRVVTTKPEGAVVSTTLSSGDFYDKGVATLKVNSSKAGNVGVQLMITASGKTYTGATTVPFGEAAAAKKSLVMFIGAKQYMVGGQAAVTDAAPFIENGRTFVAVRPIGDALGMTIYWDEATKTVTMTKPGETVTIVVGATTFKVDRAGVVTEYPTDAPAQIKDGRTYLPFRAIGEAMGYTVNYDAETQSVTFM